MKPILFRYVGGEGVATVYRPDAIYRQANRIAENGCELQVLERPGNRLRLQVVEIGGGAVIACRETCRAGPAVCGAVDRLVEYTHDVLFDAIPW